METSKKVAKLLLKINAVTLSPKKPYRFTTGLLSPIYTDCRIIMSYPSERKTIRNLLIESIKKTGINFDVIAGTATAGIPHAAWVADKLNLPMVYVRGKAKAHGKGNQIEGVIRKNQKIAVIEDLISTGQSSAETVKAVRKVGGVAGYIFAITTYGMEKSEVNFKSHKIKLITLTNLRVLVDVARKKGYIKDADAAPVLEWATGPDSWGKKMGFE